MKATQEQLEAALKAILALNPEDTGEGSNEWGEAECFHRARMLAEAALNGEEAPEFKSIYEDGEPEGSYDLSDDGDALASAGFGTDEDYGYYGEE